MAIQTFGREIFLDVYRMGEDGAIDVTLPGTGLRIDFDIRNMMGYNRGKFTIYNLNNETIKDISNEERFVSISVRTHGGETISLGDDFYISNAVTEMVLPNVMTTLYCMSGKRRSFMEKQVDTPFTERKLKPIIDALLIAAGSTDINVDYKLFSDKTLDYQYPDSKKSRFSNSVENELIKLANMFNFNYYMRNNTLLIVYNADTPSTYTSSGLKELKETVSIPVTSLISNPSVGTGIIQIESTLNGVIGPGDILDTQNMITASTTSGFEYLVAADQGLKAAATKYSKYAIYSVVNKGSNYTPTWSTVISGTTAKDGNILSKRHFNWYGGA